MGQNSTEVAYNFGQFGAAFAEASANTITAPEGLAIVAIQFLQNTVLSALITKRGESGKFINTARSANNTGEQTIQVDGTVSSSANIQFNSDVTCASLGLAVGDEVYLSLTGALLGTITVLDVGNTRTITISATTSITDDHYVSIVSPNKTGHEGTGGQTVQTDVSFPAGMTIFGRWDSVSTNANYATGGIIAYFGK